MMSEEQLAEILGECYRTAPRGQKSIECALYGIEYAWELRGRVARVVDLAHRNYEQRISYSYVEACVSLGVKLRLEGRVRRVE